MFTHRVTETINNPITDTHRSRRRLERPLDANERARRRRVPTSPTCRPRKIPKKRPPAYLAGRSVRRVHRVELITAVRRAHRP